MSEKQVTPADVTAWEDYGWWIFDQARYQELLGEHGVAVADAYVEGCMLGLDAAEDEDDEEQDDAEFTPRELALEEIACAACHFQGAAHLLHHGAERAARYGDREEAFRLIDVYKALVGLDETLYNLARMTEGLPPDNPK
jgi:hypothetical protein